MAKRRDLKPHLDEWIPGLITLWRKLQKEPGPADKLQTREFRRTASKVKELQALWDSQNPTSTLLEDDNDALGAYLLYFWPRHFSEALALIGELPKLPGRVLDIGAGLAPFGIAAMKAGADEVVITDQSPKLLKMAGELAGREGLTPTFREWNIFKEPRGIEGKFDTIFLGYFLREVFPTTMPDFISKRVDWIEKIKKRFLNENGCTVICESSFDPANAELLQCRDLLVERGISIQAPCVWKGSCPALNSKVPCFAQRPWEKPYLIQELQRGADIFLNSLKMSYLILKNGAWPQPQEEPVWRVVSPPVESAIGTRFYLCGTEGKRLLEAQSDKLGEEAKAFKYLKRGELIQVGHALEKKGTFILTDDSTLTVVAPVNKPLPEREGT